MAKILRPFYWVKNGIEHYENITAEQAKELFLDDDVKYAMPQDW